MPLCSRTRPLIHAGVAFTLPLWLLAGCGAPTSPTAIAALIPGSTDAAHPPAVGAVASVPATEDAPAAAQPPSAEAS
ncbi:MAG: hypothetical protein ACK46X_18825, partial [Candidatus Sericytochromatia bacterium]